MECLALALPLSFVGFPDWRVLDWIHHNNVQIGVGFLVGFGVAAVVVIVCLLMLKRPWKK